jgi:CRISPR-associated endonuclease/helicase Cas3
MHYYAHSRPDEPTTEHWQTMDAHSAGVASDAKKFAGPFGSETWAHNAAWLHDLGKLDSAFQGYLLRENGLDDSDYDTGRVNHSSAGAACALVKYGPLTGQVLAYLIAGHHAGLPDWHTSDTGQAALEHRLKEEGTENYARISYEAEAWLSNHLAPASPPPSFLRGHPENFHLWMRMLFSSLVDADFLDTEAFMNRQTASIRTTPQADLPTLHKRFSEHMMSMAKKCRATPVNTIRREILFACLAAAKSPSGLFSLKVPTGGGKTLSAMAFALDHARLHRKARIIYVIPYTSIIEQTAKIFADIFGPENVIEHHSNLAPEKETQRTRLASENWDAPIIVTTNVQFFESLYAAKPSRCRKLHNIVNSVIILDEAQLIPPPLLSPCVSVINQLARHYGVTLVLSTATQPALPKLDTPTEIIPPALNLYDRLKRVEYHFPCTTALNTPTDWPTLAGTLIACRQVLCIVNTRRDCHDLFSLMPEGTIHLSALMCGAHRSKIISEIKTRLAAGDPVRVISTQLVEAGVDIDFPVVYRALAGLDSIAQAAGRCNREGKLTSPGRVHVFTPPKPAPAGLLRKGEEKTKELRSLDLDPHDPDTFRRYFELFYSSLLTTGDKEFHDWLVKDVNPSLHLQFRTAAENFKLIDDTAQRPVIVRYGESENYIKDLRFAGPTRDIMRHLQRYTVNVSVRQIQRMRDTGKIEELHFAGKPSGLFVQTTLPNLYSDITGLDAFRESLPAEDLIV